MIRITLTSHPGGLVDRGDPMAGKSVDFVI
jgi:hypothetical protein